MDNQLATALAMLLWTVFIGRAPGDLQHEADSIIAQGVTDYMWGLTGSAEGKATGGLAGELHALAVKVAAGQSPTPAVPTTALSGAHTHP